MPVPSIHRPLSLLAVASLGSTPAWAYEALSTCAFGDVQTWNSSLFGAEITDVSFTSVSAQDVAFEAIEEWDDNSIGDSSLSVTASLSNFTVLDPNNNTNEFAGVSSLPDGVLGFADIRGDGCFDFNELVECDVHINATSYSWPTTSTHYDAYDAPWLADQFFYHDTLRHEVGHCLGLGHTAMGWNAAAHLATMNPTYGGKSIMGEHEYLGARNYGVSEDDREGMRAFYPDTLAVQDLAAQSYFYDDDAGDPLECSRYARPSPAFNDLTANGLAEGLAQGDCPEVTESVLPTSLGVFAGDLVDVTFSLLNLGTASQTTDARIIMTTENDPDPVNYTVVDTFGPTLNPNTPFEVTQTISIPASLDLTSHYVILQLDYNDTLSESNEDNNVAFWNREINVYGCTCSSSGGAPLGLAWMLAPLGLVAIRSRRARA